MNLIINKSGIEYTYQVSPDIKESVNITEKLHSVLGINEQCIYKYLDYYFFIIRTRLVGKNK